MNKKELKNILKPLIKECIKEVMFEDGVLSSVISEVMIATAGPIMETTKSTPPPARKQNSQALQEQRKKMLDAIGRDAYNGVNIFEGTTPTTAPSQPSHGPLAGTDPRDPGVDISNFADVGVWKKLAGN